MASAMSCEIEARAKGPHQKCRRTIGITGLLVGMAGMALAACAGTGAPPPDDGDEASRGGGTGGTAGRAGDGAGGSPGDGRRGGTSGDGGDADAAGADGGDASQAGAGGTRGGNQGGAAGSGTDEDQDSRDDDVDAAGDGSCPAGASFCSGFEDGALPAAAMFFPEYQRQRMGEFMAMDGEVKHGGTRSVRIEGKEFSQMIGVPVPGPRFWVRLYLRSDTDIQRGHNTYYLATDGNGDPNQGQAIRVGEHQCQLELNRRSDDKELLSNGGTYACEGGVKLEADKWYCLETLYDGPGSRVRVFVDGKEVETLRADDWGPYTYELFKFGFERYHGGEKTLWYDDVAVAEERIGC